MWQGNLRSRLQQDSPRAFCSAHPRQQVVPEVVSRAMMPTAAKQFRKWPTIQKHNQIDKSTYYYLYARSPNRSFTVVLQYAHVLDIETLYLAEASCDDHVSSLSLFVQDLNSSDANRGHGEDITACFTGGNRALMRRSTKLNCYKYLLTLY
jgi:hypothetical protein